MGELPAKSDVGGEKNEQRESERPSRDAPARAGEEALLPLLLAELVGPATPRAAARVS